MRLSAQPSDIGPAAAGDAGDQRTQRLSLGKAKLHHSIAALLGEGTDLIGQRRLVTPFRLRRPAVGLWEVPPALRCALLVEETRDVRAAVEVVLWRQSAD